MANSKISALTSATTPLAGTETLPIVQSSATVKATVENVFNATQPSGTAYGVVALNASKQPATSTGIKWQSNSLALNAGANAPGYNLEVVGSFRFQDTFAQNGYEYSAGSTNILTSYNRTTATWLTLRQRALSHEFYCDGSLAVTFNSSGNIVIATSGKGIDFSATPGTGTSELLADYEEGTWTPVLYSGATDATMNGATSGRYTKVGRAVHIQAYVHASSVAGIGGAALSIKGLPFAVPNLYSSYGGVTASWAGNLNITAGQSVGVSPEAGTSTFTVYIWNATSGSTGMTGTQWSNTGYIAFSLTYFV